MKPKCPCKNCDRRKIGCHARCEPYQAWAKELDERNRRKLAYYDTFKPLTGERLEKYKRKIRWK